MPDIPSLPERVDLFILAISAAQTPQAVTEIVEGQKAESVIVIPGGLEEKTGTEAIVGRMRRRAGRGARQRVAGPADQRRQLPRHPVACPAATTRCSSPSTSCLCPTGDVTPLAIVSQSGAFAVARMSKLARLNPKYAITLGNQMDLTVGDYLAYLRTTRPSRSSPSTSKGSRRSTAWRSFGRPATSRRAAAPVILYRAGRTAAGAKASASHTASIAGDYAVTRELAQAAGVIVAESLGDFEELVRLFACCGASGRTARGLAPSRTPVSSAWPSPTISAPSICPPSTRPPPRGSTPIYREARIDSVVDVHNPIDLTPMTGDAAYEAVVRAVMDAPNVDVGIVGCVPLTAALNSLPAGHGHRDDLTRPDSIGERLARLHEEIPKAWVAVVDGGAIYDPLVSLLEGHGVPTFRTADAALRLFNIFVASRLRRGQPAPIASVDPEALRTQRTLE